MKYQPTREIEFMAKSGFITKELWEQFFFSGGRSWKFQLWKNLKEERILIEHRSKNGRDIWVLNRRHPLVIKTVGDTISTAPFVAQIAHDELVSKFVLEMMRQGFGVAYRLEPELKKMAPKVVRHYETSLREKYPDGLIQLKDNQKTRVALELELTRKSPKRYRQMLDAYASYKKADLVVFILRNDRLMPTIKDAIRDSYYPKRERPIGFSRLDDWLKNPTEAKIHFTENVTTLASIVQRNEKIEA